MTLREDPNKVTYFAETDRRQKTPFGIKADDRGKHIYVIGKTGMGKSTLLENMAIQDIKSGNGVAFVDPHGKTAELLLEYVPESRIDDVVYFAPFDMENPMSFNIMEDVGYDKRHLVANGLMSAFKKIWVDAWSARMEYILNNVILALLEYPDSTLLGVNRMLTDKIYRKKVVDNITDPSTKSFWVDEFAKYTDRYTQEATPAIQNKVGQFTANPLIRNIIGQPKSSFDMRKLMDEKKILIINLSKGRIGEGNANLLGSMIITKLYLAAMSRADKQETELRRLPNFYLYVDEFQSFANESFADILSEARKYKLNLTIAHQYIEQMPEEVRAAVFGNVGTMVVFRVGAYDADVLEKEFAPKFYADDLVNLGFTQIYLKLMIDGVSSAPFSATTLPPILPPERSSKNIAIERSRELYAKPRAKVQKEIDDWYATSNNVNNTIIKEKANVLRKQSNSTCSVGRINGRTGQNNSNNFSTPRPFAKSNNFQNKLTIKPVQREYPKNKEQEFKKTIEKEVSKSLLQKPFLPQDGYEKTERKKFLSPETRKTLNETRVFRPKKIEEKTAFTTNMPAERKGSGVAKPASAANLSTGRKGSGVAKSADTQGSGEVKEEISLEDLKQEVKRAQKPKGSDNLNTLKDTLRNVMEKEGKSEEKPAFAKGSGVAKPASAKNYGVARKEESNKLGRQKEEVPEDVLKKVLEVKSE